MFEDMVGETEVGTEADPARDRLDGAFQPFNIELVVNQE